MQSETDLLIRRALVNLGRETRNERDAWHFSLLAGVVLGTIAFILVIIMWVFSPYNTTTHPLPSYQFYNLSFVGVCNLVYVAASFYQSNNMACLDIPRFTCNGTLNTTVAIGAAQMAPLVAELPTSFTPVARVNSFNGASSTDGRPQTVVLFTTSAGVLPLSSLLSTAYVTNEVAPARLMVGVSLEDMTLPIAVGDVYGPAEGIEFCYATKSAAAAGRLTISPIFGLLIFGPWIMSI